ncbi:MAG: hypothetical protein IK070_01885, partial [Clostridia bacterium]|nr:hypothetical protein [Clostridia bacterium]
MKIGKKFYLILLVLFSATLAFSACSKDPYKNMDLSLSTYSLTKEYSDDDSENYFDISATVTGVKSKDVNTAVNFEVSNTNVLAPAADAQVNGATSTMKFKMLNTGRVTIKVSTVEGGNSGIRSKNVDVQITRKVDSLELAYTTMPIIRGVATDVTAKLYDGSSFVKFTPYNTTERDVVLRALDSVTKEQITQGVAIDGNVITVTDNSLTGFILQATSATNKEVTPAEASVTVLDNVTADNFTIKATTTDDVTSDVQKIYVGNEYMYNVSLSNADSDTNTSIAKVLDVFKDGISIVSTESSYTLRARNMNKSNTSVTDLNYVSARKNTTGTFTLSEGRGVGSDVITLLVYRKGYEGVFAPIEIPVNVEVNSYPSDLKFVNALTDTDGVDAITLFTSYKSMVGTSITLSITNSNGKLVNQYAYVYVADKSTHEKVENIEKSIRIYHYVGGNLERVYANTPVKHGEKLFINYVFDATLYSENYILVAESVVFEDAFSYNAHADKHSIVLVTSDVTVSMPSTTIAKGNVRTLTKEELFGTSTPVLSVLDLKVVSSDTDIVKVIYDTVNETITLSAEDSTKIGAVTISVTAPNGYTASAVSRVYTHTDETNTSFMFGGTEYFVTDETNEVYVINDTQIVGAVVIDGVSYDNINVLLPEGMTMEVISYDTTYIQVPQEGISVIARSFTADTEVVFEFNNTYDGTSFTFNFLIHIERVVESLEINKSVVPLIYAKDSISMEGYEDVTTHTVIVTPTPAPSDYNGIYTFNTYYGGSFYNLNKVIVVGDTYEYEWRNDFKVYIRPGRVTEGGAYDGTFEVWTWIKSNSNNNYTFSVYISYTRTYVNMTESFDVRVTNSVVITSRNAVKTDNITTNLSNRKVEYNTNDLVGSDGNYQDGNIQNFRFNVSPTDRQILNDTILLGLGDANTTNLRELSTTDGVTLYANDYFNFAVDNKNKNVVVTLVHVPPTDLSVQNFILYPLDGGAIPYEFSIKVNDGLSYETAFIVTTPQQLLKISNSLSSYYRLGADIYLSAYQTDGSWIAFGSHEDPFTGYLSGEYEGKYYGIHNMRIVNTRSTGGASQLPDTAVGLFAVNKGVIEDLKLYDFLIRVNYDLTGDNVFVGGIAGINYGYIGNVEVISNTLHPTANGEYINSVSGYMAPQNGVVVRDYTTTEHTTFLGGIVGLNLGYVTNAITKVQLFANDTFAAPVLAGGVAGTNTRMTSLELEDFMRSLNLDGNIISERLATVTTGTGSIEFDSSSIKFGEYNVETTFNEYSCNGEFFLSNEDSAVGGVVGLNNLAIDSGNILIQGAYAQSYLVGYNNVGGIAGINYATIADNIAHVNIRANDNVGGVVGLNVYARSAHRFVTGVHTYVLNGTQELKGKIVDTKVQFINREDKYSYFNTGIYAHSNVGGLVGYGEYQLFDNVEPLQNSSAYSYVTREITNQPYSISHTQANGGVYYGDIVALGTSIGGLVGFANGVVANSVLANVNINTVSTAYVGGIVGKIVGDSRIKYAQIAGNVVGSTHIGGFVGDATEISDYYGNAANTNGNILRNPSSDVYSHLVAGNFVGLQYHVSASYTLLKANGNYVSNFASNGETQSGVQDLNVGYVTRTNGGIYTVYYIDNADRQSSGISDPGT